MWFISIIKAWLLLRQAPIRHKTTWSHKDYTYVYYIDGLVWDCSNSSASAMEMKSFDIFFVVCLNKYFTTQSSCLSFPRSWDAANQENFVKMTIFLYQWTMTTNSLLYPVNSEMDHYSDVMMSAMATEITGVLIVCSAVCSGVDQRKYQSSMTLAFMRAIHQRPVDSPHKWPVTRKMFPFDEVILTRSRIMSLFMDHVSSHQGKMDGTVEHWTCLLSTMMDRLDGQFVQAIHYQNRWMRWVITSTVNHNQYKRDMALEVGI